MGVSLFPAISQPQEGQLYGWLPLSNAYGIPSLAGSDAAPEGADSSRDPAIKCEMAWLLAFFYYFCR